MVPNKPLRVTHCKSCKVQYIFIDITGVCGKGKEGGDERRGRRAGGRPLEFVTWFVDVQNNPWGGAICQEVEIKLW